jgi:hypothetical protein
MGNAVIRYLDRHDTEVSIPLDRVASLHELENGLPELRLLGGERVETGRSIVELVELIPAAAPRAWLLRARDRGEDDPPVIECTRHPIIAWEIRRELTERGRYITRPIAPGAGEVEDVLLDGVVTEGEEGVFYSEGVMSHTEFIEMATSRAHCERQQKT